MKFLFHSIDISNNLIATFGETYGFQNNDEREYYVKLPHHSHSFLLFGYHYATTLVEGLFVMFLASKCLKGSVFLSKNLRHFLKSSFCLHLALFCILILIHHQFLHPYSSHYRIMCKKATAFFFVCLIIFLKVCNYKISGLGLNGWPYVRIKQYNFHLII